MINGYQELSIDRAIQDLEQNTQNPLTRTKQEIASPFYADIMCRCSLDAIRVDLDKDAFLYAGILSYDMNQESILTHGVYAGPQQFVLDQLNIEFSEIKGHLREQQRALSVYLRSKIITDTTEIRDAQEYMEQLHKALTGNPLLNNY